MKFLFQGFFSLEVLYSSFWSVENILNFGLAIRKEAVVFYCGMLSSQRVKADSRIHVSCNAGHAS